MSFLASLFENQFVLVVIVVAVCIALAGRRIDALMLARYKESLYGKAQELFVQLDDLPIPDLHTKLARYFVMAIDRFRKNRIFTSRNICLIVLGSWIATSLMYMFGAAVDMAFSESAFDFKTLDFPYYLLYLPNLIFDVIAIVVAYRITFGIATSGSLYGLILVLTMLLFSVVLFLTTHTFLIYTGSLSHQDSSITRTWGSYAETPTSNKSIELANEFQSKFKFSKKAKVEIQRYNLAKFYKTYMAISLVAIENLFRSSETYRTNIIFPAYRLLVTEERGGKLASAELDWKKTGAIGYRTLFMAMTITFQTILFALVIMSLLIMKAVLTITKFFSMYFLELSTEPVTHAEFKPFTLIGDFMAIVSIFIGYIAKYVLQ